VVSGSPNRLSEQFYKAFMIKLNSSPRSATTITTAVTIPKTSNVGTSIGLTPWAGPQRFHTAAGCQPLSDRKHRSLASVDLAPVRAKVKGCEVPMKSCLVSHCQPLESSPSRTRGDGSRPGADLRVAQVFEPNGRTLAKSDLPAGHDAAMAGDDLTGYGVKVVAGARKFSARLGR